MALEDIEKLKEKVAKDPNSRLFVPLADEYRKIGKLDEAISVLLKGLDNQPSYMSARVSLGKVYLEKKMMAEAKTEFEKVISAIPDNLFAHKKLADIYRDSGDKDRAIREYKTVLKLNSLDEDAMSNLNALQSTQKDEEVAAPVFEQTRHEESPVVESVPEVNEEDEMFPAEEPPQAVSEDEFELFRKSIAERDSEAGGLVTEEVVSGEDAGDAEDIIPEIVIDEEEIEEVEKEASAYVDMFKEAEAAPTPAAPSRLRGVPTFQPPPFPDAAQLKEAGLATGKIPMKPVSDLKEAEIFIAGGNYSRAMKVYRDMLSASPEDKYILQKIEELRMLLKMLGKEDDAVIDKLESFGEAVKKRKDEFLGNT
ncbi:MAG: tetratricopeptide repeat protein [Thermodesulfovibrionales bacterium]